MTKKSKAVSDEELITALLSCRTIKEASEKVGLSVRAIYDRMHDDGFRVMYADARATLTRTAVNDLNAAVTDAIAEIVDIMHDEKANPSTRLSAAQLILNNAERFSKRLEDEENSAQGKFWNKEEKENPASLLDFTRGLLS